MKLRIWHWKSHWKSRVMLKNWKQKKWVALKIFQCDLKSHWKSRVMLKNWKQKKWVMLKIFQCDLKSHWKSRVMLKNWKQKKWVMLRIFQCDLKFVSVTSVSLNNKGKYFLDYLCGFLCKYFSVWFPCIFSVTKIFSDFQCNNFMVRSNNITKRLFLHFSVLDTMCRWSMIKKHPQPEFGGNRFMGVRDMAAWIPN